VLCSAGFCLSGMTKPSKVIGFLDVTGQWDPTLAFVMVGAIGVAALAFRFGARRDAPVLGGRFHLPGGKTIDLRLIAGAALFGAGWGLSGLCPGPALTALASGRASALVYVAAMLAGMALYGIYERRGAGAHREDGTAED
jgi:uncharacterized membrane protein YedE/YeeE